MRDEYDEWIRWIDIGGEEEKRWSRWGEIESLTCLRLDNRYDMICFCQYSYARTNADKTTHPTIDQQLANNSSNG